MNFLEAIKQIKLEAFGIWLTMFLSFCTWPAIFFSCSVSFLKYVFILTFFSPWVSSQLTDLFFTWILDQLSLITLEDSFHTRVILNSWFTQVKSHMRSWTCLLSSCISPIGLLHMKELPCWCIHLWHLVYSELPWA